MSASVYLRMNIHRQAEGTYRVLLSKPGAQPPVREEREGLSADQVIEMAMDPPAFKKLAFFHGTHPVLGAPADLQAAADRAGVTLGGAGECSACGGTGASGGRPCANCQVSTA